MMKVIVTNRRSFQVIEWINVKSIVISQAGTHIIVTNASGGEGQYAIADYNVHIVGVSV